VGFESDTPLLRFLGKADRVSDLVGEKLSEAFVRGVLENAFRDVAVTPRFALLVPVLGTPAHYRLYVQGDVADETRLHRMLQQGLERNPHYRYATELGQLAAIEIRLLAPFPSAWTLYHEECLRRGQRAGDIKPTALDAWTGWPDVFRMLECDAAL